MELVRKITVAAAIVAAGAAERSLGTEIIAHRGASHDAPENTVAAMELAWEQGADAIETDIRLTLDRRIVALHDQTTGRTAGVRQRISRQTLEEVRQLDAGSWMGPEWTGERIPTLEEILETVPPGKRVFIELKVGRQVVPPLKQVLHASELTGEQTVIIGSSLSTLQEVKEAMPERPVYWLARVRQHPETGEWLPSVESLIRRAREAGLDGLNFQMADVIDREYVEQVRQAGLGFYVWTVNDADEARRLVEAGVDGITTDRPGWLREQIGAEAEVRGGRHVDVSQDGLQFEVAAPGEFCQNDGVRESGLETPGPCLQVTE